LQLVAPPDGQLAVAAVRESGGCSVAVSDEDTMAAQAELARTFGVFVEPAGAIAFAGHSARPLGGCCVLLMTGSGLKTRLSGASTADRVSVEQIEAA
jgi:threonine synthase